MRIHFSSSCLLIGLLICVLTATATEDRLSAIRLKAESGDLSAQNSLGAIYANGIEVTKDGPEAMKWFRKAADQGHARAQFNLGKLWFLAVVFGRL